MNCKLHGIKQQTKFNTGYSAIGPVLTILSGHKWVMARMLTINVSTGKNVIQKKNK